jgi:hypothetical protein
VARKWCGYVIGCRKAKEAGLIRIDHTSRILVSLVRSICTSGTGLSCALYYAAFFPFLHNHPYHLLAFANRGIKNLTIYPFGFRHIFRVHGKCSGRCSFDHSARTGQGDIAINGVISSIGCSEIVSDQDRVLTLRVLLQAATNWWDNFGTALAVVGMKKCWSDPQNLWLNPNTCRTSLM